MSVQRIFRRHQEREGNAVRVYLDRKGRPVAKRKHHIATAWVERKGKP